MRRFLTAFVLAFVFIGQAFAVLPDEILDDPALEQRARALSAEIRCLVCQNESIDESNAQLARDLRLLVRERLVAGDSDQQVLDFLVDRYGEFVLLRPSFNPATYALWIGPAVIFIASLTVVALRTRRKSSAVGGSAKLSEEEAARVRALLGNEEL
ncbi:MAG: cytochrome c-type biogenesis protein [Pseudomonadota bacterium]